MIFIAILLLAPLLLILLAQRVPLLDKIGVVPLAFLSGFLIAIFLKPGTIWGQDEISGLQTTLSEVSVALALPLIIFAANIRKTLRDAKGAMLAIGIAFVSVILVSLVGVLLFSGQVEKISQVAGMAVGAYTGSGINMGAIKTAIGGDEDIFLTMITYDIVFSSIYMLVVVLAGQRLAGLILRPYEGSGEAEDEAGLGGMDHLADDSAHGYKRILSRAALPGSALVVLAAGLVVAASVGIAGLFPDGASSVVTILAITTLGLAGSMVPRLHSVTTSFHLGMYLILIFCITSATMLDTTIFTDMDWSLGAYFSFVIGGSFVVQALLSRIAGIDRDTFLIASGAAIMSVPFIPVIAGALKNRSLLIPGIAIAIIGYAIGNYLGVLVAAVAGALAGG